MLNISCINLHQCDVIELFPPSGFSVFDCEPSLCQWADSSSAGGHPVSVDL